MFVPSERVTFVRLVYVAVPINATVKAVKLVPIPSAVMFVTLKSNIDFVFPASAVVGATL